MVSADRGARQEKSAPASTAPAAAPPADTRAVAPRKAAKIIDDLLAEGEPTRAQLPPEPSSSAGAYDAARGRGGQMAAPLPTETVPYAKAKFLNPNDPMLKTQLDARAPGGRRPGVTERDLQAVVPERGPSVTERDLSPVAVPPRERILTPAPGERERAMVPAPGERERAMTTAPGERERAMVPGHNERERVMATAQNERERVMASAQNERERAMAQAQAQSERERAMSAAAEADRATTQLPAVNPAQLPSPRDRMLTPSPGERERARTPVPAERERVTTPMPAQSQSQSQSIAATSGPAPVDTQRSKVWVATHKLPADPDPRLILLREPDGVRAASFRVLRHRLAERNDPRTIVVSSPGAGEGKTTCAVNLALALGECGRARVLLVEANLRSPSLAALFGFLPPECFSAQLERHRERPLDPWSVVEVGSPSLHVVAVKPGAATEGRPLLDGVALGIALDMLKRGGYDYLVIDTPPVLGSADVNLVEDFADGVLLTARSRKTSSRALKQAIEQLQPGKILGVTLLDA
jgi:Mrp family chromosome partitioning ATPase